MGMSPAKRAGFNRPEADCGRDEVDRSPQADEPPGNRPPASAATAPDCAALRAPHPIIKYLATLLIAHELLFNYQEKLNNLPLPTSRCTAAHFGLMLKLTTAPSRRPACLLPRTSRQASVRRPAQQRREIYATMNTLSIKIRPHPSYCPSLYCIPPPYCSPYSLQLLQIDKRYGLAPPLFFALTQGDIARSRSRLPYYLPPRQPAGFRIVLLLYEWFRC